jgi:hypothetical protein
MFFIFQTYFIKCLWDYIMKEIILAITNKDYSVIVKIYYQVIKFCLMVRDLSNMLKVLCLIISPIIKIK